jgi:hypothetical protein
VDLQGTEDVNPLERDMKEESAIITPGRVVSFWIVLLVGCIVAALVERGQVTEDREASCQAICVSRSVLPGRVTHYGCLCGDGSLTQEPEHNETIVQPVVVSH